MNIIKELSEREKEKKLESVDRYWRSLNEIGRLWFLSIMQNPDNARSILDIVYGKAYRDSRDLSKIQAFDTLNKLPNDVQQAIIKQRQHD
ncbi:MAG: hypothetical protein PHR39_07120 [Actinomycetota bacterium]|nr:hypothetical protein [Actinomycetota bacterium]